MKIDKNEIIKEIKEFVITFAIVFGSVYVLTHYIFVLAEVPTGSMLNTIQKGDRVFGNRLAYNRKEPERGDIIIFYAPDEPDTLYIKRLIGLPGEKVTIRDAHVYINGSETPLREDYLKEAWTSGNDGYEFEVPEGAYFFMGDNRNSSLDARYWDNTYVYRDAIVAKAKYIFFPFGNMGKLDSYKYITDTDEQ